MCLIINIGGMKGIVIVSKLWTKLLSAGKADAITIFPFIFLRYKTLKTDRRLINHERIHIRQALELLIIIFYAWYIIEFMIRFIQHKNFHQAYINISFEREAYSNENNSIYLKERKPWSFWKYL